jgi:hypothetical protein
VKPNATENPLIGGHMNTLKNALKLLSYIVLAVYLAGSAAYIGWMGWQPEPPFMDTPLIAMAVNGEVVEMGTGGVFCEFGIAWDENVLMGLNLPVIEEGNMVACDYLNGSARWSLEAFPHELGVIEL